MGAQTDSFMEQLCALGYEPELLSGEFVVFGYEVELGKHIGESVLIALQVPGDFPMSPPSGPFVSPRLLPINPGQGLGRPFDAVHTVAERGFADPQGIWEYWSRPYTAWPNTDRSVKAYLRHLRTLFGEIKPEVAEESDAQAA